jgi:septum formation protein
LKKIILASNSPRRKELLKNLGIHFSVIPADIDESFLPEEQPRDAVRRLARLKAEAVIPVLQEDCIVIAADTIVVLDGQVLGKPVDAEDAFTMLSLLSGRWHEVITAFCIRSAQAGYEVEDEITRVRFRTLSKEEIYAYINNHEFADKAGGYGIQGMGSLLVEKIEGCYFNVVGLPLSRLYSVLKKHGINLLGV